MISYILMLIIINAILLISVFLICSHLFLLDILENICKKFRKFVTKNESIFNITFLILFTLEQVLLLYLIYIFNITSLSFQLFVGILVLFVLATASLEKIISEVRNKNLKKIIYKKNLKINVIITEYKSLIKLVKAKLKMK